MIHLIYKVTYKNELYFIGRHTTESFGSGYINSLPWPFNIKSKEVLEYVNDENDLIATEEKHLIEHVGKTNCINKKAKAMTDQELQDYIAGKSHWTKSYSKEFYMYASDNF